jgi:hypothetical protein
MKWIGTEMGDVRSRMLSIVLLKNCPLDGQPVYVATLRVTSQWGPNNR